MVPWKQLTVPWKQLSVPENTFRVLHRLDLEMEQAVLLFNLLA